MRCLNIVWVVISPRSSHAFGISVVGYYVVVIGEPFIADGAFSVLLDNLPIQQFPHFSRRSEFPISPRMMRILNSSNPRLQSARIGRLFTTAAGNRFVDWAVFIATKPHSIFSWEKRRDQSLVCGDRDGESLRWAATMPVRGEYDEPDGSNPGIAEGKTARARRNGAAKRRVGGPGKCRGYGAKV